MWRCVAKVATLLRQVLLVLVLAVPVLLGVAVVLFVAPGSSTT
jgi:hypothetical protein